MLGLYLRRGLLFCKPELPICMHWEENDENSENCEKCREIKRFPSVILKSLFIFNLQLQKI